jgi:putative oxidoreductase
MAMADATVIDFSLLVLRAGLGLVILAHGWNHMFGGGKIAGTARWFDGLGMKPGLLHAWTASMTEISCGVLLILGLLNPLACGGVIGTMTVALITAHLRNGFFIFSPGQGYEYVLTLIVIALALAGVGPGAWSADHALGWVDLPTWSSPVFAVAIGFGGAAGLLAVFWRPQLEGDLG